MSAPHSSGATGRDRPGLHERALPYPRDEIKHRLQRDVLAVLSRLGFDTGKVLRDGTLWPLNPMRADRKPGSFCIWTRGDKAGGFVDFALGGGPGGKGSIYDLIGGIERHARWIDSYWWALDHLGLQHHGGRVQTKAVDVAAQEAAARDRAAAEAKAQADEEGKSAALFTLWLGLPELSAGSPAYRYLTEARGIPLERLPRLPGAIRWAPAVDYVDPETGEVSTWKACMVSAMTRGKKVVSLHRTYLKPDGSGKRGSAKDKLMIGPSRGAAIRLSNGARNITPSKAVAAGYLCPLVVGEGIETTLTAACAQPDWRAWAAGSLSLMALIDWPECASAVILLGENDGSEAARAAFTRAEAHWAAQAKGRPFKAVFPPAGVKDHNDLVKA